MYKFNKTLSLVVCAAFFPLGMALARDPLEVNFNPLTREYCHVVRFPLGWQTNWDDTNGQPPARYDFDFGDYEFRVPGLLSTRFLVRGFAPSLSRRYYTTNVYTVDLSNPSGVAQPASEEEWNSGTLVPLRYTGPAEAMVKYYQSHGFHFVASGDHGYDDRVSPDRAVWVLQSWKGTLGGSLEPGDFSLHSLLGGNSHGKLFFDAYSTSTGKKLVTVTTNFSIILPESAFRKTGWVTERYFFIPLDERMARCLVCEFGKTR
jgi:hypothetical protein